MDSGDAFFSDNGENYTLREFYDKHQDDLPKLILITQGQCGLTDMETVPAYQVIRCHRFSRQTRVMAKAKKKVTVSIPVDSQHLFKLNQEYTPGDKQSLRDILRDNALPVEVEFAVDDDKSLALNGEKTDVPDLGPLQLTDVYDVTYLVGHGVNETQLDDTPFVVPLYLNDVLLCTVSGVKGKPAGYFTNLMAFFDSRMAAMELDTVAHEDIAVYANESVTASGTPYEYLEPYDYVKLKMKRVKACAGSSTGENPQTKADDEVYEDVAVPSEDGEWYASVAESHDEDDCVNTKERSPKTGLLRQAKGHFITLRKKIIPKRASIHVDTVSSDKKGVPRSWHWPLARGTQANLYTRLQQKRKSWTSSWQTQAQSQVQDQTETDCDSPHALVGRTDPNTLPTRDLSIDELALKMEDLHLSKYVSLFKENQIDGHIAVTLTDHVLKKEFHFSAIEAIKFQHFLRTGHIPK
ncbi:uncharacterized protein LOC124273064 [Haliotis rubra]|uniref:uncharacterized protein LOC124273064 n=1 Tax=Haliotis rubra TaxID=36100 RepID=UPI001EE5D66C|nr:uncharacterized protein LOC124273064 [Haliotis rubra]